MEKTEQILLECQEDAAVNHGFDSYEHFKHKIEIGSSKAYNNKSSIETMIVDLYAKRIAEMFAEWLHEHWNAKHGGWSAKSGDIKTVYSAEVLYKSFIVS